MEKWTEYDFSGQVALVTGAARGLGQETALALARQGASLVLVDLADTQTTASRIEETGASCLELQADVSKEEQVSGITKKALDAYGKVDILINNAGISQLDYIPSQETSLEEWDRVLGVNLTGTFLMCKHIGGSMIAAQGGSIINVSSTAGLSGVPRAPAYCASKAGIIMLSKSLALEWAEYNIRVNAVAPHYLETDLTQGLRSSPKVYQGLANQVPLKRFGKPSEILGAILLLASQASSFMTGSVIVVDGGYLAK
ncbi:MAG: SDR family NAD(P)-dependent oxidoreductase [Desulfarculaceae bacterium]|jgi:NAD(P)-dependent dehydrogenase (short-subunit alcohol dehydrogenase family)